MSFRDAINKKPLNEDIQNSLQGLVDALIDAGSMTQIAHWNLRSNAFVAIHPWLGETYDALYGIADAAAEQIKQANIDLIVSVNRNTARTEINDEQELLLMVKDSLNKVKAAFATLSEDPATDSVLQSLSDMWEADVNKMIWFLTASTTPSK